MVGVGGVDGSLARWNKQRSSRLGKRVLRTPLLWDAWDVEAPAMQQLPRGLPIFTLR